MVSGAFYGHEALKWVESVGRQKTEDYLRIMEDGMLSFAD